MVRAAALSRSATAYLGCVSLPLFAEVPAAVRSTLIARCGAAWLLDAGAPPRFAGARVLDPRRSDPGRRAPIAARRRAARRPARSSVRLPVHLRDHRCGQGAAAHARANLRQFAGALLAIGMGAGDRVLAAVTLAFRRRPASPVSCPHSGRRICMRAPGRDARGARRGAGPVFGVTRVSICLPWQVRRLLQGPAAAAALAAPALNVGDGRVPMSARRD